MKKGLELSFAWMFAVLVGAVILFLAVYFAVKMIGVSEYQIDTATAKQLSIIFEPMETGLASGKSNMAVLSQEAKIYNKCYDRGFGENRISLGGADIPATNKYIFSQDVEEGKTVYFFSKPFKMPFKVSEIIYFTTQEYCFVNAPEELKEDILIGIQNIKFENCSNEIKVCFGSRNCNINVEGRCLDYKCETEYDSGIVSKSNEKIYYDSFADYSGEVDRSLMYAAIFSDKDIYECNLRRLMARLTQEALIFKDEINFLADKCGSMPEIGLIQLANMAAGFKNSENLALIKLAAENADKENNAGECKLW